MSAPLLRPASLVALSFLLIGALPAKAETESPSEEAIVIAVAPMATRGPIETKEVEGLELILAGALQREARIRAIMPSEIQTILGIEAQKQILGCDTDGSCLAEIGGALGAPYVLATQVSRVGDTWVLQTSLLDAAGGRSLHRATREVDGINPLVTAIKEAVSETLQKIPELATPAGGAATTVVDAPPPRPKRSGGGTALYWVGLGAGVAVGATGGALWAMNDGAIRSHNETVQDLIVNSDADRGDLLTLDEVQGKRTGRTLGATVAGLGGALLVADLILLLTRDKGSSGGGDGPVLSLLPTPDGAAASLTWRIP